RGDPGRGAPPGRAHGRNLAARHQPGQGAPRAGHRARPGPGGNPVRAAGELTAVLIDTSLGDLETAAKDARIAEEAGYAGAFTGELNSDPFLPLALAADATGQLTIGTAIAVAFARSPMALAYTAHDLQRLLAGRL